MNFSWKSAISRFCWDHPYLVFGLVLAVTAFMLFQFPNIQINTDPEDMLREDHPARVLDREIEDEFFLHDMVAVALEPPEGEEEITLRRLEVLYDLVRMIEQEDAGGEIHVTGLPVAEETFGHKMFQQMSTSAPIAFGR